MKYVALALAVVVSACLDVPPPATSADAGVDAGDFSVGADGGAALPPSFTGPPTRQECLDQARAIIVATYVQASNAAPREQRAMIERVIPGAERTLAACEAAADYFERNPIF